MELIGINATFKFGPDVVKEKSSKKLRDVTAFLKKFNLQRSCEYEPLRLISKALDDFKPIRELEDSMANGDGEKLVFTLQKPFDKLIEMTSLPSWLPSFNIFRNKQDDILSTMNRPMTEGMKLCLVA